MATDIKGRAPARVIRLGEELRALRRGARPDGLTLAAVVDGLKVKKPDSAWDQTKLSRIERATLLATASELDQLLDFYGLEGDDRDNLTNLRTEAPTKRWWLDYEVNAAFGEYLQLESEATETIEYAAGNTLPGLFQDEEYAAKTIAAGFDRPGGEQIDGGVSVRTKRQQRLFEHPKLQHTAYFSELALRLEEEDEEYDPETFAAQLRRTIEIAALENVTLRMVPVRAGRRGVLTSGLILMRFGVPVTSSFVFIEAVTGMLRRGSGQEVRRAEKAFERLNQLALNPLETIKALTTKLDSIS